MLNILREEKGVAIVVLAISITVLIGFAALVVDIGHLYLNKTRLANLADAAALAGAQDLPGNPDGAITSAKSYAAKNGMQGDAVQVSISDNNTTITVTATRNVPFFFAQIFDRTSSTVGARAVAAIRAITGITGIVPFGVEKQQFIYGETYTLKDGAGEGYDGNYGALALGGNGANIYKDNIEDGYSGQLRIGDWVPTEPGNMSGPTSTGIEYRISLDPAATFDTVKESSPRILIVPVLDSLSVNGRSEVQIVGFAAFFLEGVGGHGNKSYVTGRFMQMVINGETGSGTTGYGLYTAKLIE